MRNITGVVLVFLIHFGLMTCRPVSVLAATSPLLIVAVQTSGASGASEEYIELANTSLQAVQLDDTYLEYFPANSSSFQKPSRRIKLVGVIAGSQKYIVATNNYTSRSANQGFTATLATVGGHLRLIDNSGELDMVSWGTALLGDPVPVVNQPFQRRLVEGKYLDTDSSRNDFSEELASGTISSGLKLSEVLPDPAAPVLDSVGEYIEITNTSQQSLSLSGWNVTVGDSSPKTYALPDKRLDVGEYMALYVSQTKLSLGNSGSVVRLRGPSGEVVDEIVYPKAVTGSAWAWVSGQWQWTSSPTPNSPNLLVAPSAERLVGGSMKATSKISKNSKPKVQKKTVSKPKTGKVDAAATSTPVTSPQQTTPVMHNAVIAGVGGLAVLYGAYEYRYDVINLYQKLRGNRKAR